MAKINNTNLIYELHELAKTSISCHLRFIICLRNISDIIQVT